MKTDCFDYFLPPALIAQEPLPVRDSSRLLVLERQTGQIRERRFSEIADFFSAGDVLVTNNSKVLPARLRGKKDTGGQVEVFLLKTTGNGLWEALLKPAKRIFPGITIALPQGGRAKIIARLDEKRWQIQLSLPLAEEEFLEANGSVPIPPYILREEQDTRTASDKERYQTVYAQQTGSVAAPTAGLHFTKELLARIAGIGATIAPVTLHVGYGTFAPITAEDIDNHRMEAEEFVITPATATTINQAQRIISVGSTACRTLEASTDEQGLIAPGRGNSDLFIKPGYQFKAVDCLITNFHLPRSTLLVLVCAFAGSELIRLAYEYAIAHKFRFYSYGDCMLIL
ncbi:MAG: tRNA preQ1(34) S-adenosylmethionine ribosyltransferase-isomerase QueA [Deltaproteobacteria bacterium]|nr:tRNA preQ1(34) S-adenosylmethionine ribosyltransferase-isomerase QueA [Deltaproteobacteria bacterium]